jgi:hypothetical protein
MSSDGWFARLFVARDARGQVSRPFSARFCWTTLVVGAVLFGVLLSLGAPAMASFPIAQTVAAGGRDAVFRVTVGDGGQGTLNLYGTIASNNNFCRVCFLTANHVVSGTTVANIDYRGIGHAGTFNVVPSSQSLLQVGGEDMTFVGLQFNKANIGAGNFATLTGVAPLTIAANAGGTHSFQEWGYGVSGTPDTIGGTAYPFVYHAANAGEQYGVLRTFTNQLTVNTNRATAAGGLMIRDLTWDVFGPQVLLQVGSGAPGDSGAGLSDLAGPATTISGILTGGTDTRFDAAGNEVADNTFNRIAWMSALGNTDQGFGLGFTASIVTDLTNKCNVWGAALVPEPGSFVLLFFGGLVLLHRPKAVCGSSSAN